MFIMYGSFSFPRYHLRLTTASKFRVVIPIFLLRMRAQKFTGEMRKLGLQATRWWSSDFVFGHMLTVE